jgi:hypothetical protein
MRQNESQFPDMCTQAYTVKTKFMLLQGSEHITGKIFND